MKPSTTLLSLGLATLVSAQEIVVTRANSASAQPAPAEYFTGTARVELLAIGAEPGRFSCGLVHFEPGARTNWHTHPLGQTLIVTAGTGRVQHWGGPIQEIRQGDTVRIPANVKHWHGASPKVPMSHLAIAEQLDGRAVQWMEKVEDAQFDPPSPSQDASRPPPAQSRAQQLVGDIAPKLV
jgi:4-carboxymuconolactone decarboxylase